MTSNSLIDIIETPAGPAYNKTMMVIAPPTVKARYFLIVNRGNSMFGNSSASFAVDSVETKNGTVSGYFGDGDSKELLIAFPASTSYLLVQQGLVRAVSPVEALTEQAEEEKVLRAIGKTYRDAAAELEAPTSSDDERPMPGQFL